jgi:hypothetical protein
MFEKVSFSEKVTLQHFKHHHQQQKKSWMRAKMCQKSVKNIWLLLFFQRPNFCICEMGYSGEHCDECRTYPGSIQKTIFFVIGTSYFLSGLK